MIRGQLVVIFLLICLHNNRIAQDLLPFQKNGQWGYQAPQGTELIKPQYPFAKKFKNQYAIVGQQNRIGVIDIKNHLIKYDFIEYLDQDRFTLPNYLPDSLR